MRFKIREHYEKDGDIYIKCNRCLEFKHSDSFCNQKQWNFFMNKGSYCKECRAEYRKLNKDKDHVYRQEYNLKNRERLLENKREYNKKHSSELVEKSRERIKRMWYGKLHRKANYTIWRLWIRPKVCPICWASGYKIEAHHPSNEIWNEIVFCCQSCHSAIHNGFIECPKPIDLLKI